MPTFPRDRQQKVIAPDSGAVAPLSWRHDATSIPVQPVAQEFGSVSSIITNEGRDNECPSMSRCGVGLFSLAPRSKNIAKPPVPPVIDLQIWGAIAGKWVRLSGYRWTAAAWDDLGAIWWSGGLVEGYALLGRVESGIANAVELSLSVRWLADRFSDGARGASGGPGVVVVP